MTEKVVQLPPVLNFMAQWKNSDPRSVSLTPFAPFSNLSTFLIFDNLVKIVFRNTSKNVKGDSGSFSVRSITSACWPQTVASTVGCKQPLLHKLIDFLSHLLTARVQNALPALICAKDFKNIIDTQVDWGGGFSTKIFSADVSGLILYKHIFCSAEKVRIDELFSSQNTRDCNLFMCTWNASEGHTI